MNTRCFNVEQVVFWYGIYMCIWLCQEFIMNYTGNAPILMKFRTALVWCLLWKDVTCYKYMFFQGELFVLDVIRHVVKETSYEKKTQKGKKTASIIVEKGVSLDWCKRYIDATMSVFAPQITGVSVAYSTFCSGADHRKHQSSASLAFVREIHRWLVNSLHRGPETRKRIPFDYVIMSTTWHKQAVTAA